MAGKQKIWQPETAAYRRFQFPVHKEENDFAENPVRDQPAGSPDFNSSATAATDSSDSEIDESNLHAYYSQGLQEGYQKGIEEGRRLGFEEGKKQSIQQKEQQDNYLQERLIESLQQQLSGIQTQQSLDRNGLAQWIGQVVEETCRQVVRRELNTDSEQILRVIEETLKLLPESDRYSIRLNPQDAELLKKQKPDLGGAWQLVEDSNIAQGDCSIDASGAEAEAHQESRLLECLDIIRENLPVSLQEAG